MPQAARTRQRVALGIAVAVAALLSLAGPAGATTTIRSHTSIHAHHARLVRPFRHARRRHAGHHLRRAQARGAAFTSISGFNGFAETACCTDPPYVSGATGPTEVVQVDATNISVFNRSTGARITTNTLSAFCGPLAGASRTRVVYDPAADRWFLFGLGGSGGAAPLCLGASTSGDAAGGWLLYALPTPGGPAGGFALNPTVGYDEDALLLSWDNYDSAGNFASTSIVGVAKWRALIGRGFSSPVFPVTGPVVPPQVQDSNSISDWFVGAPPSGSSLLLYKATGLDRFGAQLQQTTVPVPAYKAPGAAQLPGTTDTLAAGNSSFPGPSTQISTLALGDRLVNAHVVDNGSGHPTIRWYEINADTSTLVTTGRVFESATSDDFDVAMTASTIGAPATDPIGTMFFSWTASDARNATVGSRHVPTMDLGLRTAASPVDVRRAVNHAAAVSYDPAPGTNGWSSMQLSVDPVATAGCPVGSRVAAVGPQAKTSQLWMGRVQFFGVC